MPRTKKDATEAVSIGKNEVRWVSVYDINRNLRYAITSNKDRSVYYIYDKDFKKLGKAKTPDELKEKYFGKE